MKFFLTDPIKRIEYQTYIDHSKIKEIICLTHGSGKAFIPIYRYYYQDCQGISWEMPKLKKDEIFNTIVAPCFRKR